METTQLPIEIEKLKVDLRNRINLFNTETGLVISGIIMEPRAVKRMGCDGDVIETEYQVGVSIEL